MDAVDIGTGICAKITFSSLFIQFSLIFSRYCYFMTDTLKLRVVGFTNIQEVHSLFRSGIPAFSFMNFFKFLDMTSSLEMERNHHYGVFRIRFIPTISLPMKDQSNIGILPERVVAHCPCLPGIPQGTAQEEMN